MCCRLYTVISYVTLVSSYSLMIIFLTILVYYTVSVSLFISLFKSVCFLYVFCRCLRFFLSMCTSLFLLWYTYCFYCFFRNMLMCVKCVQIVSFPLLGHTSLSSCRIKLTFWFIYLFLLWFNFIRTSFKNSFEAE